MIRPCVRQRVLVRHSNGGTECVHQKDPRFRDMLPHTAEVYGRSSSFEAEPGPPRSAVRDEQDAGHITKDSGLG